jgi:hypothetical protein
VGLLLVSGSVDVLVEEEEGNGVRNEENVPGVFSAGLKHQLTGVAEAVLYCAHRTIIDGPPKLARYLFPLEWHPCWSHCARRTRLQMIPPSLLVIFSGMGAD